MSDAKGFKQVGKLPLLKNKCMKQRLPNIFAKLLTRGNEKENVNQGLKVQSRLSKNAKQKSCQLGSVVQGVYAQGGF